MDRRQSKSKYVKNVRRFHHAKGCAIDEAYSEEELNSRVRLVAEEFEEFANACLGAIGKDEKDLKEKILREMVDIVYVLIGTAVTFGWDFDKAWDAVHAANMEKTDEQVANKDVKPEDWVEPNMNGTVCKIPFRRDTV